mmetsp:Transcript_12803/g.27520  ORF Transcript_12803/g.27520 Transcript_12803/m.27520 type:complete len:286 (-) Transcript_12803:508-1365(-)
MSPCRASCSSSCFPSCFSSCFSPLSSCFSSCFPMSSRERGGDNSLGESKSTGSGEASGLGDGTSSRESRRAESGAMSTVMSSATVTGGHDATRDSSEPHTVSGADVGDASGKEDMRVSVLGCMGERRLGVDIVRSSLTNCSGEAPSFLEPGLDGIDRVVFFEGLGRADPDICRRRAALSVLLRGVSMVDCRISSLAHVKFICIKCMMTLENRHDCPERRSMWRTHSLSLSGVDGVGVGCCSPLSRVSSALGLGDAVSSAGVAAAAVTAAGRERVGSSSMLGGWGG